MIKSKKQKHHVIRHGRSDIINIWLDRYDEIFSDFDPSPYTHRIVSDDFISEVRRIYGDKQGHIKEFNLYLPEAVRNESEEMMIKKRLHEFFRMRFENFLKEFKGIRRKGIIFALLGIVLLTIISYLLSLKSFTGIMQYIFIAAEPGGWFLVWMGLDYMFFINKPKKPEMEFYKKLYGAEISFHSTPEEKKDK